MPQHRDESTTGKDGVVLEARKLTKLYGKGPPAVADLSFEVRRGEVFGLLGSNGAGKSTTLKMFATLLRPTGGEALLLGRDVQAHPIWTKARTGFLPETPVLYETLTGREFLMLIGTLRKMEEKALRKRIGALARALEVTDALDHQVGTYSKGMRQKLVVASTLIHEPKVLLLDEPTSGLDPRYGKIVKGWIVEYAQRGGTVLVSTHNTHLAEDICTKVGIIHNGTMRATGSPAELRARHGAATLEDAFVAVVGGEAWEHLPSSE